MTAPVVLGVSGASGAALALAVARTLRDRGAPVHLVVSRGAVRTLAEEVGPDALSALQALADRVYPVGDLGAEIASGSVPTAGMVVAPCSMCTLAAIAHSFADSLLVRAADVTLKERRPLVLLARESPLHLGHLRAMAAVTEMGAIVAPPVPAFYLRPATVDDIVAQTAARAVDLLRLGPAQAKRWTP